MLLQIRDYIEREGVVSNQQLTREFNLENQALEPMLELWLRKGIIEPCKKELACKSRCFKCKTEAVVYYQLARTLGKSSNT